MRRVDVQHQVERLWAVPRQLRIDPVRQHLGLDAIAQRHRGSVHQDQRLRGGISSPPFGGPLDREPWRGPPSSAPPRRETPAARPLAGRARAACHRRAAAGAGSERRDSCVRGLARGGCAAPTPPRSRSAPPWSDRACRARGCPSRRRRSGPSMLCPGGSESAQPGPCSSWASLATRSTGRRAGPVSPRGRREASGTPSGVRHGPGAATTCRRSGLRTTPVARPAWSRRRRPVFSSAPVSHGFALGLHAARANQTTIKRRHGTLQGTLCSRSLFQSSCARAPLLSRVPQRGQRELDGVERARCGRHHLRRRC
jgi:hypothetical protein